MRRSGLASLASMAVLATTVGGVAPAADDDKLATRPYEDGPLTLRDFRGTPPPDGSRLHAFTTTDCLYRTSHHVRVTPRRATAVLTDFHAEAVMKPAESWSTRPNDWKLLEHEQGHFDLTMIVALRLRVHFAQKYKTTRLSATGGDGDAAVENLKRKVQVEVQPFFDELREGQQRYDVETGHGLRPKEQAAHREQHKAALKDLTERLRKFEK